MTYIMISFNFFTTRASQPCDRKETHQSLHSLTDNTTPSVAPAACLHLLVELGRSGESTSTVTDTGLAAADWNTVVLGLLKPTRLSPVRVVVNATAAKLKETRKGASAVSLLGQLTGRFGELLSD